MKKTALLTAAVLCASLALAGCGKADKTVYDSSEEFDVVVVGAGGAGLSAALHAVSSGAKSVAIIEMLPMTGGSLNTTAGTISGARTIIQEIDGLDGDSLESYKSDIIKEGSKNGGIPNERLVDIYVNESREVINWLWEAGLNDNQYVTDTQGHRSVFAPEHTLYSYPRTYKPLPHDKQYKAAVHELLDQLVALEPKITVRLTQKATELAPNKDGQILSVIAEDLKTGKRIRYDSAYGIIMATGGYSANPALMAEFSEHGDVIITGGLSTSTGEGFRIMQQVGAAIDERSMGWIPTFPMGLENPEMPGTGRIATTKTPFAGGILVNKEGKRFINETSSDNVEREVVLERQPDGVQYEIYTDKIAADLIASGQGGMLKAMFMQPAFAKYVTTASTLGELANKIGIPEETFLATVASYNSHVRSKTPDEFGRTFDKPVPPFSAAINAIEGNTFYAVAIKPLAIITVGGIRTNENMQVLDTKGSVIPGLYAAGEDVGGIWGRYVSSGTGVTGAVTFGKIAGENIMAAKPAKGYKPAPAANLLDASLFVKAVRAPEEKAASVPLNDGEYTAQVDGQDGKMTVKTVITAGKIASVRIVDDNETESIAGAALKSMPEAIVKANGTNVDTVTGATLTSKRIISAVNACLEQAAK